MANPQPDKIIYTMMRVSKFYGTKQVLKNISISYFYGAKIGVIGLNGRARARFSVSSRGRTPSSTVRPFFLPDIRSGCWSRRPHLDESKPSGRSWRKG